MAGSGIIYPYRHDNAKFHFVILLMVMHIKHLLFIDLSLYAVSHFHQHPQENMYEEAGDQN